MHVRRFGRSHALLAALKDYRQCRCIAARWTDRLNQLHESRRNVCCEYVPADGTGFPIIYNDPNAYAGLIIEEDSKEYFRGGNAIWDSRRN